MQGICFIEPLFKAVILGNKTVTRRIALFIKDQLTIYGEPEMFNQKYQIGKSVYLKEPYIDDLDMDHVFYKFNPDHIAMLKSSGYTKEISMPKFWKNKLFMPEDKARYFIEIKDIRLERLQDITYEECLKEGIVCSEFGYWDNGSTVSMFESAISAYADLIDRINGKGTWMKNPHVFRYEFELIKK